MTILGRADKIPRNICNLDKTDKITSQTLFIRHSEYEMRLNYPRNYTINVCPVE